jgi:uncharacterized surface anchored protein
MKKIFTLLLGIALTTAVFAYSGSVSGVVTDSATGLPVFHAYVETHHNVHNGLTRHAYTDSTGVYTVMGLRTGDYSVYASARNYFTLHYPTPVAVVDSQNTPNINFALVPPPPPPPPPTGSISGVVTDSATGLPIYHAEVTASTTNGDEHGEHHGHEAMTDSTGAYTIQSLADGNYQVKASAHSYHMMTYPTAVVVANGQNTPDINFALVPPPPPPPPPPGSISGVVTDSATGLPIVHAEITASVSNGDHHGHEAKTDSTGAYTIQYLADGNYTVTASARNYHRVIYPTPVVVANGQNTPDINFALVPPPPPPPPPTGSISGVVTDSATGLPIAHAMIMVHAANGDHFGHSAMTDSTGAYTIQHLSDGNYQVMASARNYYMMIYPTTVVVANGQNTPNINFVLIPHSTHGHMKTTD